MKVLVIGGTGTISAGIVPLLVKRGDEVIVYNRGQRQDSVPGARTVHGDRYNYPKFAEQMSPLGDFDTVIEMIGYNPEDADSLIRVFGGRTRQLIFCSTVDVYQKPAPVYPITENTPFDRTTPWDYAANKVVCEEMLREAEQNGAFRLTVIRPCQTYAGLGVLNSFGGGTKHLDRMQKGKKIIVHGDGLSLWGACHRDDVARAFVAATGNDTTFGNSYHTGADECLTWQRYQEIAAEAIGAPPPEFVRIPTDLLAKITKRAFISQVNFQFNNCFDNAAAKRDLDYRYTVSWHDGVRQGYDDLIRRGGQLENSDTDPHDDRIIAAWETLGAEMTTALSDPA